ncbi:hypothetical protein [Burkholderia sp. BCC0405]|uniref:hypothetical protein n=1 Tax=Burkholderia sp. BCC0405 TaxID=2676298 RepID=UPI001588CE45|nr:hypothetical protein [Burkholderia sp. BCC0405]
MVFIFIVSSLRLKKHGMGLPRTFTGAAMRRRNQSVDSVHRRGHTQCLPVPLSLCPEPIFRVVWLGAAARRPVRRALRTPVITDA